MLLNMISASPRHGKKTRNIGSMEAINGEAPAVGRLATRRVSLPSLLIDESSPSDFHNSRLPFRKPAQTLPEKELLETTKYLQRRFSDYNAVNQCNGTSLTPQKQAYDCLDPGSQDMAQKLSQKLDNAIPECSQSESDENLTAEMSENNRGNWQTKNRGVIKLDLGLINNALPVVSRDLDGTKRFKVKIILLGDNGVGKTTFLQTLINEKYSPVTSNLAMAHITKTIYYDGRQVDMDIHDTAGQEKYRSLTSSYYRNAHGCLVFFDVNNGGSFENVQQWLEDLKKYSTYDKLSVVLVGLVTKHSPFGSQNSKPGGSKHGYRRHSHGNIHTTKERAVPRRRAETFASSETIPYREVDMELGPRSVLDPVYRLLDSIIHSAIIRNSSQSHENPIKPLSITLDTSIPNSKCCLNS